MGGASLYRSRAFADARRRYALRQPGAQGARRGGDVLDRLVRLVKGSPRGLKLVGVIPHDCVSRVVGQREAEVHTIIDLLHGLIVRKRNEVEWLNDFLSWA